MCCRHLQSLIRLEPHKKNQQLADIPSPTLNRLISDAVRSLQSFDQIRTLCKTQEPDADIPVIRAVGYKDGNKVSQADNISAVLPTHT